MAQRVYAMGDSERPNKVKAALERFDARQSDLECDNPDHAYFIDKDGIIQSAPKDTALYDLVAEFMTRIYPEPDFKYREGDKVFDKNGDELTISKRVNSSGQPCYKTAENNNLYSESSLVADCSELILDWDGFKDDNDNAKVIGYRVMPDGDIANGTYDVQYAQDTYSKSQYAVSARAMARISHLIELPAYGGFVPIGEEAAAITLDCSDGKTTAKIEFSTTEGGALRFRNAKQAERFLEHNKQLVRDYLMMQPTNMTAEWISPKPYESE